MSYNGPPPAIHPGTVVHIDPGDPGSFLTAARLPECVYCGRPLHSNQERCPGCGAVVTGLRLGESA